MRQICEEHYLLLLKIYNTGITLTEVNYPRTASETKLFPEAFKALKNDWNLLLPTETNYVDYVLIGNFKHTYLGSTGPMHLVFN